MSNVWMQSNGNFNQVDDRFTINEQLPLGIYQVMLSKQGFYLSKIAEKFDFPYKIYGLQNDFINYVIKTYNNSDGNLGILMTGVKGTGKTVTAKELANKLNLPIIIVKGMEGANQSMIEFLSSINCNCIFFMDEYEKNFPEEDFSVLQIMDGALNNEFRKVFLLTTNELTINNNLLGRPSRIRYVKNFDNLSIELVNEYLDDTLQVPETRKELIEYIDSLSISTIDILKSIVNEINIHGIGGLKAAKSFFNVVTNNYDYTCYKSCIQRTLVYDFHDKYTIANFVEDTNTYKDHLFNYYNEDYDANKNKNKTTFRNFEACFVSSDIKVSNLKVGDTWDNDKIVQIDLKNGVIITEYDERLYFYYIKDVNAKPSLYSKPASLVF